MVAFSCHHIYRLAACKFHSKAMIFIPAFRSPDERSNLRARPTRVVRSVKVAPRMSTSEADAVSSHHEMYAAVACRRRRLLARFDLSARLSCATCLNGMDGLLRIDLSHPVRRYF